MIQRLDQLLQCCTVKITVSAQGWGTGFFVAPGWILTCAHVAKDLKPDATAKISWQQPPGSAQATLIQRIPAFDLALLQCSSPYPDRPCVYLDDAFQPTDSFYTYGYPDSFPDGASVTSQCEGDAYENGIPLILFKSGLIRPGFSGSPLLNLRTGKVCGIVKFTRDRSIDLGGGAIPTAAILQQVEGLIQQQQTFHQQNDRWSRLLPALVAEYETQRQVWMVPVSRNPFFTGRDSLIAELRASLTAGQTTAFCGLGGMGKTQTAIEYAYRYRADYEAVLWVQAEQAGEFSSGLVEVAKALKLPIAQERDETLIATMVKAWLKRHQNWLLMLDNADDLTVVQSFLRGIDIGHILLTSRAQATGAIKRIEIRQMTAEEGALLLLRRAKVIGEQENLSAAAAEARTLAVTIATQMDGLPLALDQAGAFIEETFTSLENYLAFYEAEGVKLLSERGELTDDHPSVTVTFSLAFEKVMERNFAAADLIRACAFLAPDAIPEELFRGAAVELGEHLSPLSKQPLELTKVFAEASRFSLLYRNAANRTLSIHRLVQCVLQAQMSPDECRLWAERVVRSLNQVFPKSDYPNWSLCDRLLPHARAAATLIETYQLQFVQAEAVSDLLDKTANYLCDQYQYAEAEPLFQAVLGLRQQLLGQEHPAVATCLNNLANLYSSQGHYAKAEPLYLQALELRQRLLGEEHTDVATSLNNLALLYWSQGRYAEAEPLYLQSLKLRQRLLGQEHLDVAQSLGNLANLYSDQGRYAEAESLYEQSLELRQRLLGQEHPYVATSLHNLALLYWNQGYYAKAEPLYLQSLELRQRLLGQEDLDVAISLICLASVYQNQGRYAEAESLCRQALELRQRLLGQEHPVVAHSLDYLANLYIDQGRYAEAEPFCLQALELSQRLLGQDHPLVANNLSSLASLYQSQKRYAEAEPLYLQALELRQRLLGQEHLLVTISLRNLASLYQKQERYSEAEPLYLEALELSKRLLRQEHPITITIQNNLEELRKVIEAQQSPSESLCHLRDRPGRTK